MFAATEVMNYSAGRGLRAKTVGFNRFMVWKTIRVGAIPAAGIMTTPGYNGGPGAEHAAEDPRIPEYLGAEQASFLPAILDYDRWDTIHFSGPFTWVDGSLRMTVEQDYPLTNAFTRAFYAADFVPLGAEASLDNHYLLYIDDKGL